MGNGQAESLSAARQAELQQQAAEERIGRLAEQRARELAERALARLSRLHRVRSGLSETLTPQQVAALVLTEAIGALAADGGTVSEGAELLASVGDTNSVYA